MRLDCGPEVKKGASIFVPNSGGGFQLSGGVEVPVVPVVVLVLVGEDREYPGSCICEDEHEEEYEEEVGKKKKSPPSRAARRGQFWGWEFAALSFPCRH